MKRIAAYVAIVLAVTFLITACDQGKKDDVVIDYGTSEIYTKADIDEAIAQVKEVFNTWEGCELHSIRYKSDDCNSEENINWMNEHEHKEDQDYTQCMILYSDFHSPVEGAGDLGFDPDYEYKDWNWCLARTDGGKWHLLDWGY